MLKTPPRFEALTEAQDDTAAHVFAFRGAEVLVRVGSADLIESHTLADYAPPEALPVGRLGEGYAIAHALPKDFSPPEGYEFKGLRSFFGRMDESLLAVGGRAFQVAEWARTHRFCGVCGGATERMPGERGIRCKSCGYSAYPRISPAMMVLVKKDDAILLGRNANFPPNRFSALAGFLEAGETIEECVHREVQEEVGIQVTNLQYFASQSWPFPHSLMIAFIADYAGGTLRPSPGEIEEANWYGPNDALPDLPPNLSIARALVEHGLKLTRGENWREKTDIKTWK